MDDPLAVFDKRDYILTVCNNKGREGLARIPTTEHKKRPRQAGGNEAQAPMRPLGGQEERFYAPPGLRNTVGEHFGQFGEFDFFMILGSPDPPLDHLPAWARLGQGLEKG